MRVQVRYFAAAKAAARTGEETLDVADGALIRDLIAAVVERVAGRTALGLSAPSADPADVFSRCSFILDGDSVDDSAPLREGSRLDVLPPFAGG